MATQRDLSLAYSPGVAVPVEAIAKNPDLVYDYTSKGNMVAVISNGTAILGLGNLGAMASKPVMEGKSVLFKRFADIDGYLSFYPALLECYVGGERVQPQPGGFYGGWVTSNVVGPFKGEPGTGHW